MVSHFPQRKTEVWSFYLSAFTLLFEILHDIVPYHILEFLSHSSFISVPATLDSLLFSDHLGILHFPLLDWSSSMYLCYSIPLDLCSLKRLHNI